MIDRLKELLEGYVDPGQKAVAINAVGETGLHVRLYSVFSLQAFVASLHRSQHHRMMRHFQDTYFFVYQMAQGAWLTELLRLMDRARSATRGTSNENLTVPLFHERFQASRQMDAEQKRRERSLYNDLQASYGDNCFREFRNKRVFHLDLVENLKKPVLSGNMDSLTRQLHAWYAYAAGAVTQGEPRFITQTAAKRGLEQARALKRMMLDALRYQLSRGGPYRARDYSRYGWRSGTWIDDLRSGEEA